MIAALLEPPRNLEMPGTAELLFSVFGGALLIFCIVVGVKRVRERQEWYMLLLLVGGALASLLEPAIDVLGMMYIHEEGATQAFNFLERGMPIFVPVAYAGYIGGCAYVAYRYLRNGISFQRVASQWALFVVFNIAFETPAVLLDVYTYYGPQPLSPWGFPFWYAFINPVSSLVAGAILVHLEQRVDRRTTYVLTPLVLPFAHGSAYACAALPMWATLNDADLAHGWRYVGSLLTLSLVMTLLFLVSTLLRTELASPRPRPLALTSEHVSG